VHSNNLTVNSLKIQFTRELDRLEVEITSYKYEENLWLISGNISNSAGNLCLHLIGNLRHFIGHALGKTSYIRQRDLEFITKNVPRAQLIADIHITKSEVEKALDSLTDFDLHQSFPIQKFDENHPTGYYLLHFLGHLNYHLGQINYHRRLIEH